MSKHTKGPWFAVNRGTIREPMMSVMAARIAGQKPQHEVAICATGDSPQEMENANAALIAAAPCMYEALKAAIECGMVPISSVTDSGACKHSRQVHVADMIRAAIAKAEGR